MNKTTTHSAEQPVYGSEEMVRPAPATTLPESMTAPEIAYRMVKDETYAETQPRKERLSAILRSGFMSWRRSFMNWRRNAHIWILCVFPNPTL